MALCDYPLSFSCSRSEKSHYPFLHLGPINSISFFYGCGPCFIRACFFVLNLVVSGFCLSRSQITRWLLRKATYEARREN